MDDFLTRAAEFVGSGIAGVIGLDLETAKVVGVVFILLHLLTHEVPILFLGVIGFLRLLRKKSVPSTVAANSGCGGCCKHKVEV